MSNPLRKFGEYLGLVEPGEEYQDEPAPASGVDEPVRSAAVTPIRRHAPRATGAEMNEILTVHPRAFKDVKVIAEHFRDGVPVIINITQMSESEARRLIDFTCGLAEALFGKMERVTGKVFLLSPSHVAISGEGADASDELDASFFA
ncbi:MAG TPA: cell division protein SepF [Microbacteriaceae bacterium]|nr:cell division protein SepF [Microbacteriaceae bacterium]